MPKGYHVIIVSLIFKTSLPQSVFLSMSETFEPRKVSVRDIRIWLKESMELFRRKWPVFIGFTLSYFAITYVTQDLPWISLPFGLLICQIFLSLMISTANAADESRQLKWSDYIDNLKNLLVYLIVLSFLFLIIFFLSLILSIIIMNSFDFNIPHNDYSGTQIFLLFNWLMPGLLHFMILYVCIIVTSLWFLNPLVALNNSMRLGDSIRLAKRAQRLNDWVLFIASYPPFILLYLLFLTTEWSIVISFLLYPLFSIFQYVSYRHVFLGKRENSKLVARQATGQLADLNR